MQAFTGLRGVVGVGGENLGTPSGRKEQLPRVKRLQRLLVPPEKKQKASFFFIIYLLHTRRVNNIDTSGGQRVKKGVCSDGRQREKGADGDRTQSVQSAKQGLPLFGA